MTIGEIDYEEPFSFDEVTTNTKHLPNHIQEFEIRRVESRSRVFLSAVCVVYYV